jgi:hypothetical protein
MERPSRPKESERTTRKPLPWWDRVKLLLLFATVWVGLVLGAYFRLIGAMSRYDALYYAVRMYPAVLVLFGLELIRQIHYLIAEHWKRYYAFWNRIWGRGDRARERVDPWTRFRIGRVLWVLFFLFVIGSYISHTYVFGPEQRSVSVIEGVLRAPALIMHALPGILQVVFIISIGVMQFVAIFWFMSKGGVQTYMPDDIETRFINAIQIEVESMLRHILDGGLGAIGLAHYRPREVDADFWCAAHGECRPIVEPAAQSEEPLEADGGPQQAHRELSHRAGSGACPRILDETTVRVARTDAHQASFRRRRFRR